MLDYNVRRDVAETFAGALNLTNPRFDRARFLAACGVCDNADDERHAQLEYGRNLRRGVED
jgi:hypothetical protein